MRIARCADDKWRMTGYITRKGRTDPVVTEKIRNNANSNGRQHELEPKVIS